MATFVTQGTVQVEITGKTENPEAMIVINPLQGFSVKYVDKEFIVFVRKEALKADAHRQSTKDTLKVQDCEAYVFKKSQLFQASGSLVALLTEAAFKGTKIEIGIQKLDSSAPFKEPIKIKAIKIPAAF